MASPWSPLLVLDDHVLRLTGVERPRVCFLPTASGGADHYVVRFYRAFAGRAEVSHVSLFRPRPDGGRRGGRPARPSLPGPSASAVRVQAVDGHAVETRLTVRHLGAASPALVA